MNRLQLRTLIRKNLGETTASFWTDAELNQWIADGGKDVAKKTHCVRTNLSFTPVIGTGEYVLNTQLAVTVFKVFEVYYNNGTTWTYLDETTRTELNNESDGWMSAANGTPTKYYFNEQEGILGLYVAPDTATTSGVKCYISKDHTPVSADGTSYTDIPEELQLAMADYVVAYGYQQRGWGDKSNDAWSKYFKRIKDFNALKEDPPLVMRNYRRP
jgi:hypothetical protein